MLRKMTLMMTLASCTMGNSTAVQAEDAGVRSASANGVPATMATYSRDYSCAPGGSNGYGSGGMQGGYGGLTGGNGPKPMAYGAAWGSAGNDTDCSRFYHYPYVFYPVNFEGDESYRSSDSMYYRYQQQHQIPVYNRQWHNEYPSARRYHMGHQFILDVF